MRRCSSLAFAGLSIVALAVISAVAPTGTSVPASTEAVPVAPPAVSVKVYSLADIVAPIRAQAGEPAVVSQAQWHGELQSDSAEHLERLVRVVRLAVPKEGWEEAGGPGAIAALPERLSLVVRQTEVGHAAVADLLKQLRAEDDFEIDLRVEALSFGELKEADAVKKAKLLGHSLSPDDLAELRKETQIDTSVRIANGRTVVGGGPLQFSIPRFTAVANADHSAIELRLDHFLDESGPNGSFVWTSQTQAIPVGHTVAIQVNFDGTQITYLITPQIVARQKP